MDYEKKYKEALKVMEGLYNVVKYQSSSDALLTSQTIEKAFPELCEIEDEKIRNFLIDFIKACGWSEKQFPPREDCIAWLEKQGEQKPADNVEPKFKIGDWIVCFVENEGETSIPEKVVDFSGNKVRLIDTYGVSTICPKSVLKQYHLWTIQDAKDGDVLVDSENARETILIFRKIGNTRWDDVIDYHCYYDYYREDFSVQEDVEYWGNTKDNQLKPATKEQRDLLFQKTKEAGYEWDAEKKELRKIGQKPVWSEKDERIRQCLIRDQEKALDDVRNDKYGHSEIISDLKEMYRNRIDWLKSLEERVNTKNE